MKKLVFAVIALGFLSGCSTYAVPRYSMNMDNVQCVKNCISESPGTTISVAEFTATTPGQNQIMCRGVGPIKTPDGEPFEKYIQKSFIDELRLAEAYSPDGDILVKGHLDKIDFNSNSGIWTIILNVSSSSGKSFTVQKKYDYQSSFYGETACNQTAQAMLPAVQDLIKAVFSSPNFRRIVANKE